MSKYHPSLSKSKTELITLLNYNHHFLQSTLSDKRMLFFIYIVTFLINTQQHSSSPSYYFPKNIDIIS